MTPPAWYTWRNDDAPIVWDDEGARRASTRRSQYHHEAPADLTPDMYDDPYMEFADPADETLLDREEAGFYDDDYPRWDLLLGGNL